MTLIKMNKNTSTYQYYSALHLLQLSKIPVPGTELNVQKQCAFDICTGAAYSDGILTGICCLAIHASIVKKNTNTYHHAMETHLCSRESCLCRSECCRQCRWTAGHVCCRDLSSSPVPLCDASVPDLHSAVSGSARHCRSPPVALLPELHAAPAAKICRICQL